MAERSQYTGRGSAERDPLARPWTKSHGTEHLRTAQYEANRPIDLSSGHRREYNVRPGRALAAKTAAHELGDDTDLGGGDSELRGHRLAIGVDSLRRVVECEAVAGPHGGSGVRLHRIVIFHRCRVRLRHASRGRREARLDVPARGISRLTHHTLGCIRGCHLGIHIRHRGLRFVLDENQRRRIARMLKRVGHDDRDRLIGEVHDVVLQKVQYPRRRIASRSTLALRRKAHDIPMREHGYDSGSTLCVARVDVGDAALGDRAHHEHRVRQAWRRIFRRISRGTCDLDATIDSIERLADHIVMRQAAHVSLPTVVNARTMVRLASSILKALYRCGVASRSATSAAS